MAIRPQHLLLFLFVTCIWGLNFAVAKVALEQLPPLFLMTLRFTLVALLLLPFVSLPRGRLGAIFGISITLGFLHFSFMFSGMRILDASTAAIAIQLQVPFASLLAAFFFKDKLGWRRALGMAVAFIGVAVIAGEPRLQGQYLALAMVIFAACMWSVANVQIKKLGEIDGFTLNGWMAAFAAPQLAIGSLVLEDNQLAALLAADAWAYFAIFYQAIVIVVIGYGIWYWLLGRYDMNQAMPFTLLVPLFGVMSGVVFLGESLSFHLIAGGLLTIVGVGVIVLRRPKVAAPQAQRL